MPRPASPLIAIMLLPALGGAAPYPLREYLQPFWEGDTLHHESVLMVSDAGKPAEAALLFPPVRILSVRSAGLDTLYREGTDWIYAEGRLKLLPGGKAPFLTTAELYPTASRPDWDMPRRGGGYLLFQEGHWFHDRQLSVTYTHARNLWTGPAPALSTRLTHTLDRLAKGLPLRIALLGNSITHGYNASHFTGAAPYMPAFGELAAENLRTRYASAITVKNAAVPGKDAAWGAENVRTLVTSWNPDLVVISFGMNDGGANVSASAFLERIKAIIADVRSASPAAEFILIAPMLANPESHFAGNQAAYAPALRTLAGPGIDMVDMTAVHQELLKRKAYRDMTGNHVNHPNDFLHRWYAQQICALLIPPGSPTTAQARQPTTHRFRPTQLPVPAFPRGEKTYLPDGTMAR